MNNKKDFNNLQVLIIQLNKTKAIEIEQDQQEVQGLRNYDGSMLIYSSCKGISCSHFFRIQRSGESCCNLHCRERKGNWARNSLIIANLYYPSNIFILHSHPFKLLKLY